MHFELTGSDKALLSSDVLRFQLSSVNDVDGLIGGDRDIVFQFPPVIKADSKAAKWHELTNNPSFEPTYMYFGALPRKISVSTVYVVGGPSGGSSTSWTAMAVAEQLRVWKAYFYFSNLAGGGGSGGSGGGIAAGSALPVYRIVWGTLLEATDKNSTWRAISYNVKNSDTWVRDETGEFPLTSEITVELELVTQVNTTGVARMGYDNMAQFAKQEWY